MTINIDIISDLHGEEPELPGGDLLIIAGDLTCWDKTSEHERCKEWILGQDYKRKVLVAGNHDRHIQNRFLPRYDDGIDYLQDSGIEIEGLKIWGSPWTHKFWGVNPTCTAFMIHKCQMADKWALIPDDVDILITHTPPNGILDQSSHSERVGCEHLYKRLSGLTKLKLHCFGHIHESHGHISMMLDFPGVQFVNASIMNGDYDPVNKPTRITL